MTPTELQTFIRQKYNIVGDNFWSDEEIYNIIWEASYQLAREAYVIEGTYTTTTVAGTQSYSYPTNAIALKRVTWYGRKLQPINMREDDSLTGNLQSSTSQGDPQFYYVWDETIYLRPIPSSAQTLQIFSFDKPQRITSSSTLDVPEQFHMDMVDFVLSNIHAKEKNFAGAQYYLGLWQAKVAKIKAWQRKRLRSDAFSNVQDIDSLSETFVGNT